MAPQSTIPLPSTILGTIGTIFWCVQLLPQLWTNHRSKSTEGLPGTMMFLWALSGVPTGVYAIVQHFNLPLQIQPQIFILLTLLCFAQTLVYHDRWSAARALLTILLVALVFAGAEAGLIVGLRGPYASGVDAPVLAVGVVAAVLLAAGIVPPYFELAKRNGRVVGINFWFLAVDWLGAFFNLMALVAQDAFDVLGGVMFAVVLALETGIFVSHVVWRVRTRRGRREKSAVVEVEADEEGGKEQSAQAREEAELGSRPSTVVAEELRDLEKGRGERDLG
ncbi:MAG: hypothetical protein M1816_001423 [Peltula sp. TS41687]|nr:MAG: hypothetical protein M1816_001423 [Peltula sp. TS41687]